MRRSSRSAAAALVELEVPVRLGLGRVESGRLVELEGVLGVEFEIGLGRAAGGRDGRRCGGQVERADALKALVPDRMDLPEMALRFILSNDGVATVIPGMRKRRHVEANIRSSDAGPLPFGPLGRLRAHRWDRTPTAWSQ